MLSTVRPRPRDRPEVVSRATGWPGLGPANGMPEFAARVRGCAACPAKDQTLMFAVDVRLSTCKLELLALASMKHERY
jgi:hypothetical protein